ncbi:hypothetical protein N0V95_008590 [Ascochyta clinopodiicola]|nr:hypothetical protein N0V95_008590 [Ascochyta clinopodiicola]
MLRHTPPPRSPAVPHVSSVSNVSSRAHTPQHLPVSTSTATTPALDPPVDALAPSSPHSASPAPRSPSPSLPPSLRSRKHDHPAATMTTGTRPGAHNMHNMHNIHYSPHHNDAHQSPPQRPHVSSSMSAPAGRLPRLLPADLSLYSDALVPTAAIPTSATSLAELAHLIRLQGYQEQRKAHSRVRLHRWLVSSALSARLVHCGELAYRSLVDNFRSDDKKSFASLYNALNDVRNSCDATRQYALLEPDLELGKAKSTLKTDRAALSFSTFLNHVPSKILDHLLDFISEVRTNPDFLAARIASLSQQELASLSSFRQTLDPVESVMAITGARAKNPAASKPAQSGPTPVERLLSFQRHDPLAALIYTIFANSSGPDSAEDLRRTDVWATTCAKMIKENKAGTDRFVKTVLDVWAGMREWPGKTNLELYLMQVLQDGQFLLEKAEDQPTRQGQPAPRTTKDTIAADEFFDKAVKRLFEVVDDEPSAGGIPEGILEIGNAILRKLDDERGIRRKAQSFFVSRWLFTTYLMNAIIHPEACHPTPTIPVPS